MLLVLKHAGLLSKLDEMKLRFLVNLYLKIIYVHAHTDIFFNRFIRTQICIEKSYFRGLANNRCPIVTKLFS